LAPRLDASGELLGTGKGDYGGWLHKQTLMIGFNDILCIFMYIYEIQNRHKLAWKLFMYILDFIPSLFW
jgi:hypothetical protein